MSFQKIFNLVIVMRYLEFFTATILEWKHLLIEDKYKLIVLNSLKFLVKNKRINLCCYVIMPNHIHLIWQILEPHKREDVQRDFLKFVSQQIKLDLKKNNPKLLEKFHVGLKDREYQIWKRNPLSVELYSREVVEQKLEYIHLNPLGTRWNLVKRPEFYEWSSARYYEFGNEPNEFITHYMELT